MCLFESRPHLGEQTCVLLKERHQLDVEQLGVELCRPQEQGWFCHGPWMQTEMCWHDIFISAGRNRGVPLQLQN